jgi:modification methylase smeI
MESEKMSQFKDRIFHADCLEGMREMPDGCVDLVVADPPYNIGKADWDKIPDYIEWSRKWIQECERFLKPTGVFYFWHNDMPQLAGIMEMIRKSTHFRFKSFCILEKKNFRTFIWKNRSADSAGKPRVWFPVTEYCLHYVNGGDNAHASIGPSVLEWYAAEMKRLGITREDIAKKYTEATGRPPHMLRHYFGSVQFEFPTRAVWESVFKPLGFSEGIWELGAEHVHVSRYTHNIDAEHCNVWVTPVDSSKRLHTCQKPQHVIERIIRVSSNPGDLVLDPFMGSGTTAVACVHAGRHYVGFEKDKGYYTAAVERTARASM